MKHASLRDWSPYALAELGLFDDTEACADALIDAPILVLATGETLMESRSGEALAVLSLDGTLQVQNGGDVSKHGRGSLLGLPQLLSTAGQRLVIRALTRSVIVLLDRRRVHHLSEQSPLFARRVVRELFVHPAQHEREMPLVASARQCNSTAPLPDAVSCVILVRLVNRESLELCHGKAAVEAAMHSLGRAIEQSVRPSDMCLQLVDGEYLVGIDGDMLSASIVASRLVNRTSRVVVFADMRIELPHLQVVIGIAIPDSGETIISAAAKARGSAIQAARVGAAYGGALV
ncbi:hypothetical protein [Massilia sp.]|uniref:hypothetical protein n=1 Tax=Massilia sp. TaxID=1882437 RepID=UPI00352EF158